MRKFISKILLLVVTIIWGMAFVWQNIASKVLGGFTIVGLRALIALLFLILVVVILPDLYRSQNPKIKIASFKNQNLILSLACGLALFFAMCIQQLGIAHTTASKAGFISVLYICIVPIIGIFLGHKINKYFLIGLVMSVVGLYLLSIKGDFTLEYGDLLVLISAFLFAVHILIIDYSAVRVNSMFLSIGQLIVVAILSLITGYFLEGFVMADIILVLPHLLALGTLSSGVAYTLQIIGQREIPAHTASLIMSLESVVAALGGVFILGEVLTTKEIIGMLLVLIGIIISQKR
ncbi:MULTISPECIES: DMT family transporter [unclassified Gemella]|uniref:DMT family transporter n=1 Tax=unclassified Gemella TaxID=2624949 RepID=UPI001C04C810|nr:MULTISPECIES: DMT family transporter [unclassified Gemella]MBU0279120.1 DMT family transporter [Gemella sp. zg-1178]QWQ38509.1 DMT family transporter [Gemella sp. zg-570]